MARKLVFLAGGVTHSSLGGIGFAYYAGLDTTLGALVAAVVSAFSIDYLASPTRTKNKNKNISEDSAIGIVWSAGMAMGMIFIFITPGYAPNLMTFLFGNLLLTGSQELLYLAIFDILILLLFTIFGRQINYAAMDSEYAMSQRIRVKAINILMLITICISIVINIKVLGIILMISMMTVPAVIAAIWVRRLPAIMIVSSILAVFSALAGLILSYLYDTPSAATSVIILVGLLIASKLVKQVYRHTL